MPAAETAAVAHAAVFRKLRRECSWSNSTGVVRSISASIPIVSFLHGPFGPCFLRRTLSVQPLSCHPLTASYVTPSDLDQSRPSPPPLRHHVPSNKMLALRHIKAAWQIQHFLMLGARDTSLCQHSYDQQHGRR